MIITADIYPDTIKTSEPVDAETMQILQIVAAYLRQKRT
jgi:hypothetical protein